jgi:cytochrome c biogenesis protein CcmG, thiol:disulfide interchange protein DsbE
MNPAGEDVRICKGIRMMLPVLLALAVASCATPRDRATPAAAAGDPTPAATVAARASRPPRGILPTVRRARAPQLRVVAFDGTTVTLESLSGRPVVVSFFESWCPVCRAEQPDLSRVAAEFSGRVGFVGVSNHDTVEGGRTYQRRFKVPYPLANDASGRTWARWKVPYQPVVVLVDKQGRIAERFDGGTTARTLADALTYLSGE